jgi:microcystin-dependent protein
MADPFVAEVRIFPFNFPPKGWAFCDGQILPLSQNTALFSLLGTTYGGDGKSNFALPNVQGNCVVHPGQGAGLTLRDLGEEGGSETVTLLQSEIPAHNHIVQGNDLSTADNNAPGNTLILGIAQSNVYTNAAANNTMSLQTLAVTGGSLPHNNMMPYLTLNFCIALQGVFPPRT